MERKNQETEIKNQEDDVLKKSKKAIEKWNTIKEEAEEYAKAIQEGQIWGEALDNWWVVDLKKWDDIEIQAKADIDAWDWLKYNTDGEKSRAAYNVIVAAYSARAAARNAAKAIETYYIIPGAKDREKREKINELLYLYTRIDRDNITEKSKKAIEKWQAVRKEAKKTINLIQCKGDLDFEVVMQERQKWVDIEMLAIANIQTWKMVKRVAVFDDISQAAKDVIAAATSAAQAAREARAEADTYMIAWAIANEKPEKLAKLLNL